MRARGRDTYTGESKLGSEFAEALTAGLPPSIIVLDGDMARTAYRVNPPDIPFNISIEEAKRLGSMIGCDFFTLTKSALHAPQ